MEQQVVIRERGPTQPVPVQSETAAIISMIERAARDPAVDIDKLRQLMEMRSQVEAKAAEREFYTAMSEAQTEMGRVRADATNPQTRSRYATYPQLDRALRPIYTSHGLSLSFDTEDGPENCVRVVCYVARGGYVRKYRIDMPADGKGAKGGDVMTKTHATGSAVSYGMRYLLKMIFNIAVGEDDDGNAAGYGGEKINKTQVAQIQALIVETASDIQRFCKHMKVERIEDMPQSRFKAAISALEAKRDK